MNEAECAGPYPLLGPVARHPLDCRAYVPNCAVDLEESDDVGGVPKQGADALLALFKSFLDLLALGDVADHTREQSFTILIGFAEGHLNGELAAVLSQPHELGRAAHDARLARSQVTVQPGHAKFSVSFGHKQ